MNHLAVLQRNDQLKNDLANLKIKATGEYFTPEVVGRRMARELLIASGGNRRQPLSVVDPFCGDGRLIAWLLDEVASTVPHLKFSTWNIHLWDVSSKNIDIAIESVRAAAKRNSVNITINSMLGDSFEFTQTNFSSFDLIITNPPWELLKPDRRELEKLDERSTADYINGLHLFAEKLKGKYVYSIPSRVFSGWGYNLSRFGLEASLKLLNPQGHMAIIMPASWLADQTSSRLREWAFSSFYFKSINHYPAETRLFDGVDQPFNYSIVSRELPINRPTKIVAYDHKISPSSSLQIKLNTKWIRQGGYCIPTTLTSKQLAVLEKVRLHPTLSSLEGTKPGQIWIGRELDETGYKGFIAKSGSYQFLKGRSMERFALREGETMFIAPHKEAAIPASADYQRIIWRDVSRASQKRRIQATLIPGGYVTGNSLGVIHDWGVGSHLLEWILGVTSSIVFEYQIRALLSTVHVSAGVVRSTSIPIGCKEKHEVVNLTSKRLKKDLAAEVDLEVTVAKHYGLNRAEFKEILDLFPKVSNDERQTLLKSSLWWT